MLSRGLVRSALSIGALLCTLGGSASLCVRASAAETASQKRWLGAMLPKMRSHAVISWKKKELEKIKLPFIPPHKLPGEKILEIWREVENCSIQRRSKGYPKVGRCIKELYSRDPAEILPGRPTEESSMKKDMTEVAFVEMKRIIGRNNAEEIHELLANLEMLDDRISRSASTQLILLGEICVRLHFRDKLLGPFESFIKAKIVITDTALFRDFACPPRRGLLGAWGKMTEISKACTGCRDRANPSSGTEVIPPEYKKAQLYLDAPEKYFTPKYAIKKLKQAINASKDKKRVGEAKLFLQSKAKNGGEKEDKIHSYILGIFRFEDENARKLLEPKAITHEGVEEILVKMGLLERNIVK